MIPAHSLPRPGLPAGVAWLALVVAALLIRPSTDAHPLGPASVDRFARLEITPGKIIVIYDLNMAEESSASELSTLDANHDGVYDGAEKQAYAADLARKTAANLSLEINGQPLTLRPVAPKVFVTAGEANRPTLRLIMTMETLPGAIDATLRADRPPTATFHDDNAPKQVGWRQIGVEGLGVTVSTMTVNGHAATLSAQGYLTDVSSEQTAAFWIGFSFVAPAKKASSSSPAH